jgi:hypothetical protein
MTENESNEFNALVNGDLADLAEVQAPEVDQRKDGIYYHATTEFPAGNVVYYQVIVDHRFVAMIRIDEGLQLEAPGAALNDVLNPGTTFHQIALVSLNCTNMVTTKGWTFKAPDGILNRSAIKAYVMPRLPKLLVRLYNLGT